MGARNVGKHTLSFMIIYPDRLWQSGDMGMVRALDYRSQGRSITIDWQICNYGEALDLSQISAVILGGRTITDPASLMDDLKRLKARQLQEMIAEGLPLLAVGAGFAICCREFETLHQRTIPGLGIFDTVSTHPNLRKQHGDLLLWSPWLLPETLGDSQQATPRFTDLRPEEAVRDELIITNVRQGRRAAKPEPQDALGSVIFNVDQGREVEYEGMRREQIIGTHAQGSILPLNPALTDWFLEQALLYQEAKPLAPMEKEAETLVRQKILERMINDY